MIRIMDRKKERSCSWADTLQGLVKFLEDCGNVGRRLGVVRKGILGGLFDSLVGVRGDQLGKSWAIGAMATAIKLVST
jgi:hypothetical protein